MRITDVTNKVRFGNVDDECLPLPVLRCVCGEKFDELGEFVITVHKDWPHECPKCGAKLFFTIKIKVYQVKKGN